MVRAVCDQTPFPPPPTVPPSATGVPALTGVSPTGTVTTAVVLLAELTSVAFESVSFAV